MSFMFSANSELCDTVLLSDLNLNIPVNTRDWFMLTEFWTTLYTRRAYVQKYPAKLGLCVWDSMSVAMFSYL
jgi:hypothetical protein